MCDAGSCLEIAPCHRLSPGSTASKDMRHMVADPARDAEVLGFRVVVGPCEFAVAPLR